MLNYDINIVCFSFSDRLFLVQYDDFIRVYLVAKLNTLCGSSTNVHVHYIVHNHYSIVHDRHYKKISLQLDFYILQNIRSNNIITH